MKKCKVTAHLGLDHQASNSLDLANSEQQSFSQSKQEALNQTIGLTDTYSEAKKNNTEWFKNMSADERESFEKLEGIRDEVGLGKDRNNTTEVNASGAVTGGVKFSGGPLAQAASIATGVSGHVGAEARVGGSSANQSSEKYSKLENALNSEDAKKALSVAMGSGKNSNYGESASKAKSLAEGITSSTNEAVDHRSARDVALRQHDALSKQASLASNKDSSYNQDLSQDYSKWLGSKASSGEITKDQYNKAIYGNAPERSVLGQKFADERVASIKHNAKANMQNFKGGNQMRSIYNVDKKALQKLGGNNYREQVRNQANNSGVLNKDVNNDTKTVANDNLANTRTRINEGTAKVKEKAKDRRAKSEKGRDKSLVNALVPDAVPEVVSGIINKVGQGSPLVREVASLNGKPEGKG